MAGAFCVGLAFLAGLLELLGLWPDDWDVNVVVLMLTLIALAMLLASGILQEFFARVR